MANGKTQDWLPLLNYSTKHNVSLSTLRRRIKSRSIEYKLDQGKYFILEGGQKDHVTPALETPLSTEPALQQQSNYVEASVLSSANRLVEEIKSAYAKILQEKEEQISQLKEEIGDLKMLVRILESQSVATEKKLGTTEVEPKEDFSSENFLFGDYQDRGL